MALNPDFRDLFSEFNTAEVRYLVVGAQAVIFYTVPRYTRDLDVWIDPSPENTRRAFEGLARFGAPLGNVRPEDLAVPGTVLQLGVEPNRIDVLNRIGSLVFEDAWSRREASTYAGIPIGVLGLDDLIAAKREAGRPQDLLDASWLEKARGRRQGA